MSVLADKCRYLRINNVETITTEAERLDLPEGSVDVVVSNLGVNNIGNTSVVLTNCHRFLRPGGVIVLSTNLDGHMREFYDVFRRVLARHDLHTRPLDNHVAGRGSVDSMIAALAGAGFEDIRVDSGTIRSRYANGTALLAHRFTQLAFRDAWERLVPRDYIDVVFAHLEEELNAAALDDGCLELTVPTACFVAARGKT